MRNLIKKLKYYIRYKLFGDEIYIKYKFKKRFGYKLDFNNPKTINEKIQWLKLYDRTPLHTKCADKFLVREYIKEMIGENYLIPLIFDTFATKNISIENLPDYPIVIKANHTRGAFLIKNKNTVDLESIKNKLDEELASNFYYRTREWQYKDIKPRIIVEKMLLDEKGNLPIDYKIWCMNGKVVMFQVDTGTPGNHIITFFDKNWKAFSFKKNYPINKNVDIPNNLKEMIFIAEKLSEKFLFVRVDLYNINNKVYFGELTFHPESGFGKFYPNEADLDLGNILILPKKNN